MKVLNTNNYPVLIDVGKDTITIYPDQVVEVPDGIDLPTGVIVLSAGKVERKKKEREE